MQHVGLHASALAVGMGGWHVSAGTPVSTTSCAARPAHSRFILALGAVSPAVVACLAVRKAVRASVSLLHESASAPFVPLRGLAPPRIQDLQSEALRSSHKQPAKGRNRRKAGGKQAVNRRKAGGKQAESRRKAGGHSIILRKLLASRQRHWSLPSSATLTRVAGWLTVSRCRCTAHRTCTVATGSSTCSHALVLCCNRRT